MAISRSINDVKNFMIKADRALPPEQQTIFEIRLPNASLRNKIKGAGLDYSNNRITSQVLLSIQNEALKECLKGWQNLRNEKGEELPFHVDQTTGKPTKETLETIREFVDEIFGFLISDEAEGVKKPEDLDS